MGEALPGNPELVVTGSPRRRWLMSLRELADALGINKSSVQKWEKGCTALTVDRLLQVAAVLGCEPVDLLPAAARPPR